VKKKKNQNRTEQNKERASEERNTTNKTLERSNDLLRINLHPFKKRISLETIIIHNIPKGM
jgi:hypothetical protein